jgi:hypothetical protein
VNIDTLAAQHAAMRVMERLDGGESLPALLPGVRSESAYLRDVLTTLVEEIERDVLALGESPYQSGCVHRSSVLRLLARRKGEA